MNSSELICVNNGKKEIVGKAGAQYYCYAIKTRTITDSDEIIDVIDVYAKPVIQDKDVLFISEKMVACTQGRAILLSSIKPTRLATFLSKHVTKSKYGIGLAMPQTMQCALDECGVVRILFASFISVIGKIFGAKGVFYKVAGRKAAAIDGPCEWTLPPYNHYVVLSPKEPDKTCREISEFLGGTTVLIVDLNDLGGEILGSSDTGIDKEYLLSMLKQNPLGQSNQSTPMGILRPL